MGNYFTKIIIYQVFTFILKKIFLYKLTYYCCILQHTTSLLPVKKQLQTYSY